MVVDVLYAAQVRRNRKVSENGKIYNAQSVGISTIAGLGLGGVCAEERGA